MQHTTPFQVYNASAGSGKTFTLVKEYLKIILVSTNAYKFQQILAVTFTNKAAGEMKERVIKNLHQFSKEEENDLLFIICQETNLLKKDVFKRSKLILNAILQNYSGFNITTIDSFTYKLIRTFAYDLHLPMNFEVELDAETLLNEAVDLVIASIGTQKELTDLLINYSLQKLDDDKSWDISIELKNFARIILNEDDAKNLKKLEKVSIKEFQQLKEKLQNDTKKIATLFIEIGKKGEQLVHKSGAQLNEFANGGDLPNHFKKLIRFKQKPTDLNFEGRLNKNIEANKSLFSGKCSPASKKSIEDFSEEFKQIYYDSKTCYQTYFSTYILNKLIVESLIPLAVLSFINNELDNIKKENNILLNAEFNNKISESIKNQPAPFIYERLGEKFRYFFIDEMQDTSVLQWENLIPLIGHVLASEDESGKAGKLVLVGDAKQSIYRWRGGKAEQFIKLSSSEMKKENNPFFVDKSLQNLGTNFRSYSEIIQFNNSFFQHLSKFLQNAEFSKLFLEGNSQNCNKNEGGFVQLSFVEKLKDDEERDLVYPKKVLEIIQNLDENFKKNEVCVLVRTKKQGINVANYLSKNGIEIISSETLLIKNSNRVAFIIDLLNVLQNPLNNEFKIKILYFLFDFLNIKEEKHTFLSRFVNLNQQLFFEELRNYQLYFSTIEFYQLPFYESIEYIIRSFNLVHTSDSNIQFFLDQIFEFQQKKNPSIQEFLEFWELKSEKLTIVAPEAQNAVRIMTIHKSKGLEFPVVIFPYNMEIYKQISPKIWYHYENSTAVKSVLLNYSDKLNHIDEQGKQLFNQRREELELDNFNLLYVALTRAIEQLYIVSEKSTSSKKEENLNHSSGLFINYLKEIHQWDTAKSVYDFGNPIRLSKKEEEKSDIKTIDQHEFISNSWKNHQISIVANSSLLWETSQGEAINYGNLIHEILSKIKSKNDIESVVNQYWFKGEIKNRDIILKLLTKIVEHPQLAPFFKEENEIFSEKEIVTNEHQIVIPDRLIFNDTKVSIIDYKTGKPDKKYHHQLLKYADALKNLNYIIDKKILVYISDEIIVEEV